MSPLRPFPAAALLFLLAGCVSKQEGRAPTATELYELSLEELLEIRIETVRSVHGGDWSPVVLASAALCASVSAGRSRRGSS